MLQPYGIQLLGDLAGTALVGAGWLLLRRAPTFANAWLFVHAALSLAGSVSLIPTAVRRGDFGVEAYHLGWILISALLAGYALRNLYRHARRPDPESGDHGTGPVEPDWDDLVGLDEHGNPVYRSTEL